MARTRQQEASQPDVSAWVEANAGTGKTKVLTDRVIRLLLAGAAPERILCLTFTKAAAAEMRNRIAARLAGWVRCSDADLVGELRELGIASPGEATCTEARRLFARVLDAAGGLRIQTLHAFCEAVLKRFPLEAGVAPHFAVIEDRDRTDLLLQARDATLDEIDREPASPLATDFAVLQDWLAETGFDELMQNLLAGRGRRTVVADAAALDDGEISRRLAAAMGLPDIETVAKERAAATRLSAETEQALKEAAVILAQGSKTEQPRGATMLAWLDDRKRRAETFEDYCTAFFKEGGTGEPFANPVTQGTAKAHPGLPDLIVAETERLLEHRRRVGAASILAASMAALRFARAVFARYRRAKAAKAALDFDDLIARTAELLASRADWVLYKLDRGLDHVLVDEAQDTSPEQWRILRWLTGEFFAGEGAHGAGPPTVFAVGDPKQSIYSFQGAEPAGFGAQRAYYRERVVDVSGDEAFRDVLLDRSFRSVPAVLELVDAAFTGDEGSRGVVTGDHPLSHAAARKDQPGEVEWWLAVPYADPPAHEEWQPQPETGDTPELTLARTLAARIAESIGRDTLPARGRPVRAGDIMVLVRTRTRFVDTLVSELKDRKVEVAGVDRMRIGAQLAVRDLMAFARVLLLPEDDLSLAEVLKGPLGGLDDAMLFDLAHGRGEASLWEVLRACAAAQPDTPVAGALARIERWRSRAGFLRPYELFARLLAEGGRAALLARLGEEAADPIDEFLGLALAYERAHPPALQGFLHWLAEGETEIKRDLDHGRRDEVRVLTVHGAKGLQAPVVYLPDTVRLPGQAKRDHLHWIDLDGLHAPLWNPLAQRDGGAAQAQRDARDAATMEEYNRLLYVALTRAEDKLVICGAENRNNRADKPECWHALVRAGLERLGAASVPAAGLGLDWEGDGLRHAPEGRGRRDAEEDRATAGDADVLDGSWRQAPAPREAPALLVAPSRAGADDRDAGDAEPPPLAPLGGAREALARGRVVHRLLQHLADLEPGARAAAGMRLLARPDPDLAGQDAEALLREVLRVLEDARFAPWFGSGSRAEVPVAGEVGGIAIAGQIDRLAVTDAAVYIIDYKTNRPPPDDEARVPALYLRQMAAYRALLQRIYPEREVRCALLWTAGRAGPNAMELSDSALSRHAPGAG